MHYNINSFLKALRIKYLNLIDFKKSNIRFLVAVSINSIALIFSVIWLISSNIGGNKDFEFEPLVTTFTLLAALFSLVFLNNKLTYPHLKLSIGVGIQSKTGKIALNIGVANHSFMKVYLSSIFLTVRDNGIEKNIFFLNDSFTGQYIKNEIDSGERLNFHLGKTAILLDDYQTSDYLKFTVKTQLGFEFYIKQDLIRQSIQSLNF
ncbi:hypothetical protein [Pseudoalteromonas fuliginea]|uniref:Uncharacterized protein n=1 Tax=Pseudoalteromonas fuliginea TaxID=1872678 RepID=A0ABD3Y6V7_9GAMM|nr:hypothetical protein [Pseudoalteromonas fuliginea]KDC49905.1 hypothetical protein DC53_14550 [Pseudoalteromonas fuliginea]KJZ28133.1 hypothetical protein TW82_08860 [Pseudoalteromonas fuliginea]